MDNFTVAKTLSNWGANEDLDQLGEQEVKEEKFIFSIDQLTLFKEDLLNECETLISSAKSLYDNVAYKELHDAIITLGSVKKSLDRIHIKQN